MKVVLCMWSIFPKYFSPLIWRIYLCNFYFQLNRGSRTGRCFCSCCVPPEWPVTDSKAGVPAQPWAGPSSWCATACNSPFFLFFFFKNHKAMTTLVLSFPFLVFLKSNSFERVMRSRKEREHQKSRVHSRAPDDRPAEDLELSSVTEQQLQNQRERGWPAVEHTWECSPVRGAKPSCPHARRAGAGLVVFWQGILFC